MKNIEKKDSNIHKENLKKDTLLKWILNKLNSLIIEGNSKNFFEHLDSEITAIFNIVPGVSFEFNYSKELRKLVSSKNLEKYQKKEKAIELKSHFMRQVEGMAYCRIVIEKILDKYPNTDYLILKKYLFKFIDYYGICELKKVEYLSILDNVCTYRDNIISVRKHYPDNLKLIHELFDNNNLSLEEFSKNIDNEFKIETNPYCLVIYTSKRNTNKFNTSKKESIGGFCTYRLIKVKSENNSWKEITVPLIVIQKSKFSRFDKITFIHELEHAKNLSIIDKEGLSFRRQEMLGDYMSINHSKIKKDFKRLNEKKELLQYDLLISNDSQKKLEINKEILELENKIIELDEYFKRKIYFLTYESLYIALERARDEILAMKKDRSSNYFENLGNPGNYNYDLDFPLDLKSELAGNGLKQYASIIFDVQRQFTENISKCLKSFDELEKNGFSRDEVIAILGSTPILSWSRIADCLIDYKKKK